MRTPESCSFRTTVSTDGAAVCELVRSIVGGGNQPNIGQVREDACLACCSSHPVPNDQDLNPVLASLLFCEAERLQQLPDCGGCVRSRVDAALQRAEAGVPVLLPTEEESAPVALDRLSDEITVEDIIQVVPLPRPDIDDREQCVRWAIGVTTAPRRQPTLTACLETLVAAGFDDPHLFVDGQMQLPLFAQRFQQTTRADQQGAWLNYYRSLQDLLANSDADVFMLVQDDTAFPPTAALRPYLDRVVRQLGPNHLLSLYCPTDYDGNTPGWGTWNAVWHFGALAFVWSRSLAEAFVADPKVAAYELPSEGKRKAGIDVVIGEWALRAGVSVYRSTPSIVQHIGHVSSIWETSRAIGLRRATNYVGDWLAAH